VTEFKAAAIVLASALLFACDQFPGMAGPPVAVVDLNAIAEATGQDTAMQDQAEAARSNLDRQLNQVAAELGQQLEAEREKLGDSETDQAQFQELTTQAQQQYARTQALANQRAQEYQAGLVARFRGTVQPIAMAVAREHGASVVFVAGSTLFWWEPAVDLTEEVIAELRAQEISFPEPEPLEVTPSAGADTQGATPGR